MKPPESLVTQLDIYTEEKFEDEEDLRERSLANHRRREASESELMLEDVIKAARGYDELYPAVIKVISPLQQLLDRESST